MTLPSPLNPTDLEHALREALPPEQHAQAPALALAILAAAQGNGHTALTDPALRPALRALAGEEVRSDGALISFGAGAQLGAVSIGDVAGGDLIKISLQLPPSTLTPQERRNSQAMIKKVRAIWVDGLLKQSLEATGRIELSLTERPDLVAQPLTEQYQELRRDPRDLPTGTSITDVFEASGGSLLILGAPGAGKTTLLLELCRDLLDLAEADETQPIPVVFNLSSWVVKREPIERWLSDELRMRYNIPQTLAHTWLRSSVVLPLLDGLDEISPSHRAAGVAALNAYTRATLPPLVVCSRLTAYTALEASLSLHTAILIQPLSDAQLTAYSATHPDVAEMVQQTRQLEGEQDLPRTPMMVFVMTRALQADAGLAREPHHEGRRLWDGYVQFALGRRSAFSQYTRRQLLQWLRWLAERMVRHHQSTFFLERMQFDWSSAGPWRRRAIRVGLACLVGIIVACLVLVATWMAMSALEGVIALLRLPISGGGTSYLVTGMLVFLMAAGIATFPASVATRRLLPLRDTLAAFRFSRAWFRTFRQQVRETQQLHRMIPDTIRPEEILIIDTVRWSWRQAAPGIFLGAVLGFFYALLILTLLGLQSLMFLPPPLPMLLIILAGSLLCWLGATVGFSAISGLVTGFIGDTVKQNDHPNEGVRRAARLALRTGLGAWILSGIGMAVALGVSIGLSEALLGYAYGGFQNALILFIVNGVAFGVNFALFFGSLVGIAIMMIYGGDTVLKHLTLRALVAQADRLPLHLPHFLDACADRALLYRVGGGYIFMHRLLMEHFAAMTDDDIARLSAAIDARRR